MSFAVVAGCGTPLVGCIRAARPPGSKTLSFQEIPRQATETLVVPEGFKFDVLIRWGDPLFSDAPEFKPSPPGSLWGQSQQFGFNSESVLFLPNSTSADARHSEGLLCATHQYFDYDLVYAQPRIRNQQELAQEIQHRADMGRAATGLSLVEVREVDGRWSIDKDSKKNRRYTNDSSVCEFAGPAAESKWLKSPLSRSGRYSLGMLNPGVLGVTPWNTLLICEEQFGQYFRAGKELRIDRRLTRRYGVEDPWENWADSDRRFDLAHSANAANHFGWMIELDPFAAGEPPKKRTALGRLKHNAATCSIGSDGQLVVLLADDERFEYVYKFVSASRIDDIDPRASRSPLDDGTLSVAVFREDGTMEWKPLLHGVGPITQENGFESQDTVMVFARLAADLLGATKLDRPQGMASDPATGDIFIMLTGNRPRRADLVDAANPRADNAFGHAIRISPSGGNTAAPTGSWDVYFLGGDPSIVEIGARFPPAVSRDGWIERPEHALFGPGGVLWITGKTLGGEPGTGYGSLYAIADPKSAHSRCFARSPRGCEFGRPAFSPDGAAMFVPVQWTDRPVPHGASGWPDFKLGIPPRPAIVAISGFESDAGGRLAGQSPEPR